MREALEKFKQLEREALIAQYERKSQDPDYCGYNALQCAAYDGNMAAVKAIVENSKDSKALLSFVNEKSPGRGEATHENILHVAMKDPKIFEYVCHEILKQDGLLTTLLTQKDMDGDNVLHQLQGFGREGAQKFLEASKNPEVQTAMNKAAAQENTAGKTPAQINKGEYLQESEPAAAP